jgi:hypothetical protein
MVLCVILFVDIGLGALRHQLQSGITDRDRKPETQIQHAALTAVLKARARQADVRFFVTNSPVHAPSEHRERSRADLAFHPRLFFDHLDVRIRAQTVFAHAREVSGFTPGSVDVGFRGHGGCLLLWVVLDGLVMLVAEVGS